MLIIIGSNTFGKYRKLKSSIHWTLGHVIQFISMNSGYSLAEMSENSVEATIKSYRYITNHLSRNCSFAANCSDCLKVLNICSLQSIRKFNFNSKEKNDFPLKDDEESDKIIFSEWELYKLG